MAPVPSQHNDPNVQDEMFNRTVLTTALCITGLVFLGMVVYLYWRLLRCSFKRQPPVNTGRPLKKLVLLNQINQLAKPCRLLGFSSIPQDMEKAITVKDESRIIEGVSRPVQTNRSVILAIKVYYLLLLLFLSLIFACCISRRSIPGLRYCTYIQYSESCGCNASTPSTPWIWKILRI